MHADDRTMLARLGFADPDKREARHDLACQYLGQPQVADKLIKLLGIRHGPVPSKGSRWPVEWTEVVAREVVRKSVAYEEPISKGFGPYMTTIGFIDLVFALEVKATFTDYRQRERINNGKWSEWKLATVSPDLAIAKVGIEVKIHPVSVGDLIRQVKLYQSYREDIKHWIAATDYPISHANLAYLTNEGIRHIRLGKGFAEYVASHQDSGVAASVEI